MNTATFIQFPLLLIIYCTVYYPDSKEMAKI